MSAHETEILEVARQWLQAGHGVALATVVKTSGSAPRQTGSHIAVRDDGLFAGSVSAGCVEGAIIEEAQAAMKDGRHRTLSFGVSEDGVFDTGLLCGGQIEILDRADPLMRKAILEQLAAARRDGRPMVRAIDPGNGEERLIDPMTDSSALGRAAAEALARDASGQVTVETRDWFLTLYNVPQELVIVGAVHIAQALAALALAAGYRVRVIDPRPAYAAEERFAGIRLVKEWPGEALAAEPLTRRSALVALAHDPKVDDPGLAAALASQAFYVGALGSRRTHGRRLARLKMLGFSDAELARIRGPVGLAIGARSPSEIAIAILAEMIQVRRAPKPARIGGVVLAAGLSRRMGHNKLVAEVNGKSLVRHAAEAALEAGLDPVTVVTGHQQLEIEKALAGLPVRFVHNPSFADGLSTSLKKGIESLPEDCAAAMVLLGDMPGVTPDLARRVAAAFEPAKGRSICVAAADGERGHPVLWARQFFPELMQLSGDQGARGLMAAHAENIVEVVAGDAGPLTDLDTPEALENYLAQTMR